MEPRSASRFHFAVLDGRRDTSFNCWSASCALRSWPTVFLSSPPFFHGLHSPQALLFCALNRRWVSLVFMFIHSTASSLCSPQYSSIRVGPKPRLPEPAAAQARERGAGLK
jgi:hypothetical protein